MAVNRQVFTYCMVKTLYDNKKDFKDIFIPFILLILCKSYPDRLDVQEIKKYLLEQYTIDIPILVLGGILFRARRLGYIDYNFKKARIIQLGRDYLERLPSTKDVNSIISTFSRDLYNYVELYYHLTSMPQDKLMNDFFIFINENIYTLLLYVDSDYEPTERLLDIPNANQIFINYLLNIQKSKPDLFRILEDLIYGSIICILAKNEDLQKNDFKGKYIFLDTNIVFSILGYHHDEFSIPCEELRQNLINKQFKMYIFDFTLKEIIRVLKGYKTEYYHYVEDIKINSVYSKMKSELKLAPSDIDEIISNIEDILEQKQIYIYPINSFEREELDVGSHFP